MKKALLIGEGINGGSEKKIVEKKRMKKTLVIGEGISGVSAKKLLEEKGYKVTISSTNRSFSPKDFELLVLSPGVDPFHCSLVPFHGKIEVISEVELAFRYCCCKVIGVTGTNGKSSLVTFLGNMLRGKVCGNIGVAASAVLPYLDKDTFAVIELSSFQLEFTFKKQLLAAILLNISEDHMDRYKSFACYVKAKMRIKELVVPSGFFFKEEKSDKEGFGPFSGSIVELIKDLQKKIGGDIFYAKSRFKSLPHRLQFVCKKNGVTFVNDSKATNPAATVYATKRIKGFIVLLVGGLNKNTDFSIWNKKLDNRIKAIICFGSSKDNIKKILRSNFIVYTVTKMEDAIDKAKAISLKGDTVLLSPGCASYDYYTGYAHRGEVFTKEVTR